MKFATMVKGVGEDRYLVTDRDGAVRVHEEPLEEVVKGVEESYNRHHDRGYESSMSACVHNIFFQPVIIPVPDSVEKLKTLLVMDGVYRIHNVSGSYSGWKIKPEVVKELLEKGVKPRLISERK